MELNRLRKCAGLAAVAGLGASFVVLAEPAHAQDVREVEPVLVPVGSVARSVSVGDMNNDGVIDLVTPTRGGAVTAVLGQGDGSFDQPYVAGRSGQRLRSSEVGDSVVGDFDHDGRLDLAVAAGGGWSAGAPALLVFRGEGAGLLGRQLTYPLDGDPGPLTTADLNGDGDHDLLLAMPGGDAVQIFLGTGDLGFDQIEPVAVGALPRGLDVADLDGDGSLDFAVANRESDTVSVRYGDGTGLFPTGVEVPTRPAPQDVELADLEGDGIVDLVVGSNDDPLAATGTLAVLRGSGSAQFTEIRTYETLKSINSVTAADFDQDGYLDFVIGTGNNGAFGFSEPAPGYVTVVGGRPGDTSQIVVSKVGASSGDVVVADLDGDTDLDLVSTRGLFFVAILFDPLGSP